MKITLLLVCLLASLLVASTQQPKVVLKLNNGTEKQYNIADIENLSIMKSGDPLYLTVFYNGTNRKFTTTAIESITVSGTLLTIFSKPTGFECTLAEVDSIIIEKIIQSQAPSIEWQKCFGRKGRDIASSIQQTIDGGYIITGYSESDSSNVKGNHDDDNCWIVKLSSFGSIEWQKSFGGSGSDYAESLQQTTDSGYIIAGRSDSNSGDITGNHGLFDYWIIKLSSDGSAQWQKSLGGSLGDGASSIQQTNDGGYIVAGDATSNDGDVSGNHGYQDYWVVKLTKYGSVEWQKSLGGSGQDHARSIQKTSDGGYIVVGDSESNDGDVTGNHDMADSWIVKLTSDGSIEWQKSLGGSDYDYATSIQKTSDGGYIVACCAGSSDGDVTGNHGSSDSWILKLASDGSTQWQKCFGGSFDDTANSIQQTNDGGYIVAGISYSNNGDITESHGDGGDYWILKLSSIGTIEWQKCLGGSGTDWATSIQQTSDGGYIVAGWSNSNDGDVTGNHGNYDYWVVKLKAP